MTRQFYLWCALKWVEIQILGYLSGKGTAPSYQTREISGVQGQHLQDELVGGEVSGCLCHRRMVRMGKDQSSGTRTLPIWSCAVIGHELSLQPPSDMPVDLLFKEICLLGLSPACDLLPGLPGGWGHRCVLL